MPGGKARDNPIHVLGEIIRDSDDAWFVASMIRGPDVYAQSLKYIFTGRVRWVLTRRGVPFTVRPHPTVSVERIAGAVVEVCRGHIHYLMKAREAVRALRNAGLIDDDEKEFLTDLDDALSFIAASFDCSGYADAGAEHVMDSAIRVINRIMDRYPHLVE